MSWNSTATLGMLRARAGPDDASRVISEGWGGLKLIAGRYGFRDGQNCAMVFGEKRFSFPMEKDDPTCQECGCSRGKAMK